MLRAWIAPLALIVFLLGLHPLTARGQSWPRFRGPNGQGHGPSLELPSAWTEAHYRWKVPLPGAGHSSPIIWSNRLFVASADESAGHMHALCLDAVDGRTLWQASTRLERYPKHNYNSFASGTPAADENRVYFSFVTPARFLVMAYEHSGRQVWERDLGPFSSQHGPGGSPIVVGERVVVSNEQDGESFLTALDAASGRTLWKTPRRTAEAAYATPCLYQPAGGPLLLIFSSEAHGVSAIDPANGSPVWDYTKAFDKRVVSSPVLAGNLILASCGSGGGGNYVIAIRPPRAGGSAEVAWTLRRSAPYVPTSVAFRDWIYLWSDGGIVSCVVAATGEVLYQERVGGNFFSSPVLLGDRLLGISTRGEAVMLATGDRFQVLGRSQLGETVHSTPAITDGALYIRTIGHLLCVGPKAKSP